MVGDPAIASAAFQEFGTNVGRVRSGVDVLLTLQDVDMHGWQLTRAGAQKFTSAHVAIFR
jgi:hypothetical protein